MNLTDDEVRARFSAFHDGELPAAETTWIRARIDENAELRRDYEGFCKVLDSLSGMSAEDETGSGAAERVDVLASVQKTLHSNT